MSKPLTTIDTDKKAGFTSWKAAEYAARRETSGPKIFWREHITEYQKWLLKAEKAGNHSGAASLRKLIAKQTKYLLAYDDCKKYVVRGKPDPHAVSPTY